jgi:hypothetical protein
MAIDEKVNVPTAKNDEYHSNDAACSAEFSDEGCKIPEGDADDLSTRDERVLFLFGGGQTRKSGREPVAGLFERKLL